MRANKTASILITLFLTMMMVTSVTAPLTFAVEESDTGSVQTQGAAVTENANEPDPQAVENSSETAEPKAPEEDGDSAASEEEQTENTENSARPSMKSSGNNSPAKTAGTGGYILKFTPQGEGYASYFDMNVYILDAEGNYLETHNLNSTDKWETLTFRDNYSVSPCTIMIKCSYKYNYEGEDWEELSYEAPFPEFCSNEKASGISSGNRPGEERVFCLYSIESMENGSPASYVDAQGNPHVQENCINFAGSLPDSGWYVARDPYNVYTGSALVVGDAKRVDVNLILSDDVKWTFESGVVIKEGSTLTIWGQEGQSGSLTAKGSFTFGSGTADTGTAGISLEPPTEGLPGGKLIINGGTITATGGSGWKETGAANNHIGSGTAGIRVPEGTELSINAGNVTATGIWHLDVVQSGPAGAGIGGNMGENSGNITITGGRVKAGSTHAGAGIGGGGGGRDGNNDNDIPGGDSGPISISGGIVEATGGPYGGAGIGGGCHGTNGEISISNGVVKASHYKQDNDTEWSACGTGIGAGAGKKQSGKITISGGAAVFAEGCRGAGIGGGGHTSANDTGEGYDAGEIEIRDYCAVIAYSDIGAGIGGGGAGAGSEGGDGGSITIDGRGVDVMAVSTRKGAGIGGGNGGDGGHVVINSGNVAACGGNTSRGVFTDLMENWNDAVNPALPGSYNTGAFFGVILEQLIAMGDWAGAGIGGGDDGDGGTVEINGGTVAACGGNNGSTIAIGYGDGGDSKGSLTIYENSRTTYGHLDDGKVKEEGAVKGPDDGAAMAQSNTYAKIEPGEILVTFDMNGHGTAPDPNPQAVTYGDKVNRPADPSAEDCFFGGWFRDKNCTATFDFDDRILRDTTIYAKWVHKRTLKITKKWNNAAASEIPDNVSIQYRVDNVELRDYSERFSSGYLELSADNNWTAEITVSDEAIIKLTEDSMEDFTAGDFVMGGIVLPVERFSDGARSTLDLRDQEESGLNERDHNAAVTLVKGGNACVTINNNHKRKYSVKKIWDLPKGQRAYCGDVKAVLQHREKGEWKTLQEITLKNPDKKNSVEGNFDPVADDGKGAFRNYRVRELDKDGNIVLDSTDEGGSEDPAALLQITPYSIEEIEVSYDVSYQEDASKAETVITNKNEGIPYSAKVIWLDCNGREDDVHPDGVSVALCKTTPDPQGKRSLEDLYESAPEVEHLELSDENDWKGTFAYLVEDTDYQAREVVGRGIVYVEGDSEPYNPAFKEGKAEFEVSENGQTKRYEYDVSIEVDKENHLTTIINKRTGIIYSVKKEWDVPEGSEWPDGIGETYAVLQHRIRNAGGTEVWRNIDGYVQLEKQADGVSEAAFPAVSINDGYSDDDYRVREFVLHIYDKNRPTGRPSNYSWKSYFTFIDPEDIVQEVESIDPHEGSSMGRILLAENDADNTGHLKPVFFARHVSGNYTDDSKNTIEGTTSFTATCSRDKNGNFVITNHQEGQIHETTDISGSVIWNDDDDKDGYRPNHVTINLLADGERAASIVVTAADGWKWELSDLPKYDKGKEIKYEISEDHVNGYSAKINGYDVTNSHFSERITVYARKTWTDKGNETSRPGQITLNLFADGKKIRSQTVDVSAEDYYNIKYPFTGLDKYRDHGTRIKYTITEEPVTNYATSANGVFVVNTYAPEKTQVSVHKVWEDEDDQDGIRPKSVAVKLLAGKTDTGKTIELTDAGGWSGMFTDLDKYDKTGKKISYSVEEVGTDVITGEDAAGTYSSSITGDAAGGYIITNKHTPASMDITAYGKWDDNINQDGDRPNSFIVRLRADGQEVESGKVGTILEGWRHTFRDLPVYRNGRKINYSISADAIDNYTSTVSGDAEKGFVITNRHTPGKVQINVSKTWLDDNNRDGKRPAMVTVHLFADGKDTGEVLTLTGAGGWEGSFTGLDEYFEGKKVSYSIKEDAAEGYASSMTGNAEEGYTLVNSHNPELRTINVKKVWDDSDDQDGKRPDSVIVRLRAGGGAVAYKEVTEADNWECSFEDVYAYEGGYRLSYTVSEDAADGYTTAIGKDDGGNFTITNTRAPDKTQVAVYKAWDDMGDREGFRPESVKVRLLKDGKPAEGVSTLELNEENDWSGTFDDLDKYENQGGTIIYGVEEVRDDVITGTDGDGTYADTVSGDQITGYTITNIHAPRLMEIPVSIEWDDDNDRDGVRPDIVALRMLANGQQNAMTFIKKEENGEDRKFINMLRFEDGRRNNWTMSVTDMEGDPIEGYDVIVTGSETEGFHAVLRHVPLKTRVSVNKVWDDAGNRDGIRPDSITVRLLANDEATDKTLVLSENNDWAAEFTDIYKNEAGKPVRYSIKELRTKVVTGQDSERTYSSTVSGDADNGFTVTNTHTPADGQDPASTPDPAAKDYRITYRLTGGTFNGSSEDIAEDHKDGTVITIHEAPVREGYEFLYWKGSEYYPGDRYAVTEDHVFTAQWKKSAKPENKNKPGRPGGGIRTGDEADVIVWIAAMISAALLLAVIGLMHRRRSL